VKRAIAIALLSAYMLAAPASLAEPLKKPETEAGAQDRARAQRLLKEGNQFVGDGEYMAALERFRSAYELYPSPKILINLGTTLRQLGRNVEAAETYEAYVRHPEADPERRASIERIIRDVDVGLGHLRVEVKPEGATVRLDGKPLPEERLGVAFRIEPGEHTIVAEKPGMPAVIEAVRIERGQEKLVRLLVTPTKPVKPVVVQSAPSPSPSPAQRNVGLVVGAVGIAGLGAGVAFGLLARSTNEEATSHCLGGGSRCDATGMELGSRALTWSYLSTASLAVGGAALVAGIVTVATAPSAKRSAPRVGLSPLPGGAFLSIGGGL
jgi:hypothetical protein